MAGSGPANPGFVYDGYEQFWHVADLLMHDLEPSDAQWQALLSASGYRELVAHELTPDVFAENLRLAFKPSLGAPLAHVLQGGSQASLIRHYILTADMRRNIARRMDAMAAAPLAAAAREAALSWLPAGLSPAFPTVAFVIFGPDARSYLSVVLDAAYVCQQESPLPLLAHEYHHVFRRHLVAARPAQDPGDKDLLWVLNQLESEGIADQIDKRSWPADPPSATGAVTNYARQYRKQYAVAPDQIRRMDTLLSAWHRIPARRNELARRLRASLPLAGHPTGSFMARRIEARFGRQGCIDAVGNPFAFVRLYSEAAASGDGAAPPLCRESLSAIATLERIYLTSA